MLYNMRTGPKIRCPLRDSKPGAQQYKAVTLAIIPRGNQIYLLPILFTELSCWLSDLGFLIDIKYKKLRLTDMN